MMNRVLRATILGLLLLLPSSSSAQLPAAARSCANQIMLRSRNYVSSVQNRIRATINSNLVGTDRFCGSGRRCGAFGDSCVTSATCGGLGCYPNLASGGGVSRYICQYQNTFRNSVVSSCTPTDIAELGFPSPLCPTATTELDVAQCILQNNASYRDRAIIVDTTFEPMRRGVTQIEVPHPAGFLPFATYPNEICGVPGSYLLDYGTQSNAPIIGVEGGFRPLYTDGPCLGSVCNTKGDSVTAFANNLLEPPLQTYAGLIPVCLLLRPADAGNGTFEAGTINLNTGEQFSFEPMEIVVLAGTTCPICNSVGQCDSGTNAGQPCGGCGGEQSFGCPPTIGGSPPIIRLPLLLSTGSAILSAPPNGPGVTNPVGAVCGACSPPDEGVGCQSDSECTASGATPPCVFSSDPGFHGDPASTLLTVTGARGPFIPHLAGVGCGGKTGSALIDSVAGFPGPWRYVEPRLNVYAW